MFMKKYLFILLTVVYLIGSGILGGFMLHEMHEFKGYKVAYADELDISNTMLDASEYLFSSEKDRTEASANFKLRESLASYDRAWLYAIILLGITVFYIGGVYSFFRKKQFSLSQMAIGSIVISAVFLFLGIFVPMLEISVFLEGFTGDLSKIPILGSLLPEVSIDGKIYAFYQCKSIADLIAILFASNNYFVGIAILCFSCLFPLLKLIFSFMFILNKSLRKKKYFVNTVSYIGKFSMADVMVVAIFLALLAFGNMSQAITTEANVLLGIYLFAGYCILSILVFFVIKKLTGKVLVEKYIEDVDAVDLDLEH